MKKKKMIGITVLLLAIGFAAVSTTLVLTGVIGVGSSDDFSVIFTKALLNGETSENAVISADKKTITFTTDKMTMVDETQVLDYTVKNNSTQYDANVTINCTNLQSEYVTVVNTLAGTDITTDNETYMEAQESKDGDITITMIKPYIEDEDVNLPITCNIVAEAVPRDDEVEAGDDLIDDESSIPDEIRITDNSDTPSTSPVKLKYEDGSEDNVVPTSEGIVTPVSGKRLTGIFTASDDDCNLLLGVCNGITANRNRKLYDIVKSQNLGSDIALGIDYNSISSNTNGKGVYSTKETQDGSSIYFYRGAVNDNHVVIGDTCWKILHTTEGKGTKLLYDGLKTDNMCDNADYYLNIGSVSSSKYNFGTSTYYISKEYSFNPKTGVFSLVNPIRDRLSADYLGYYITTSASPTSIDKIESIESETQYKKSTISRKISYKPHLGYTSFNNGQNDQTFVGYMTGADVTNLVSKKGYAAVSQKYYSLNASELSEYTIGDDLNFDSSNSSFSLVNPRTPTSIEEIGGKFLKKSESSLPVFVYYRDPDYEAGNVFDVISFSIAPYFYTSSEEEALSNTYDSTVKKIIDDWYENNIKGTQYESLIEDTIYCNDRSLATSVDNTNFGLFTSSGIHLPNSQYLSNKPELVRNLNNKVFGRFGRNAVMYSVTQRYGMGTTDYRPTYKCADKNDSFTVTESNTGNGALKYPVALPTADEAMFAGLVLKEENTDTFIYNRSPLLSMTPGDSSSSGYMYYFSYKIMNNEVYGSNVASPVLSLKNEVIVKGSGSARNPYVIIN